MKKISLAMMALVCFFGASTSFATFLPPNNLYLQDHINKAANMTEAEFGQIIDKVIDYYKPIAEQYGAVLTCNKKWTDPTVNASAGQKGTSWYVNMYGGLARRDEITPDGFAMVVCHELGHHFGGYYFYDSWFGGADWAASEGQSDYFAMQSCAREIWKSETDLNKQFRDTVAPFVKQKCDEVWATEEEQNLCYRINSSGQSLANLLSALVQLA